MELSEARNRSLDKTKPRYFVYHPTEEPLIVYEHEAKEWYAKGWADTPAKFINMEEKAKEIGMPEKEVKKAFDEVKRDVNEKINIYTMNAKELADFLTRKADGGKYNRNMGKKFLLEMAERVVEGEIVINVDDMEDAGVDKEFSDEELTGDNSTEDSTGSI